MITNSEYCESTNKQISNNVCQKIRNKSFQSNNNFDQRHLVTVQSYNKDQKPVILLKTVSVLSCKNLVENELEKTCHFFQNKPLQNFQNFQKPLQIKKLFIGNFGKVNINCQSSNS
jgi:hypothetical protein